MPLTSEAGFLSNLLGTDAVAGVPEIISSNISETNSQNMALLQANLFYASIIEEKKQNKTAKTAKKDDESAIKEDVDINIVSDNALSPATSPLGVSDGTDDIEPSFDQISVYVVRPGDSITAIAKMFDVSVNTIMYANDLKNKKLIIGDTLIILPVSGLKYIVEKGDTLKSIAKEYKVDVSEITDFNGLATDTKLAIGEELIIPGAELEIKAESVKTTKNSKGQTTPNNYNTSDNKKYFGRFIKPIDCRMSQGQHDRYAIDLACGKSGVPIKASMEGKVIFAKKGWNGAFGNLTIIENAGIQTFYAHQSEIYVSVGQQISQGQIIGTVGNTGRSTGPHLHFEVRGRAKNPGFDNSWAK